jgi:hypothetical protein
LNTTRSCCEPSPPPTTAVRAKAACSVSGECPSSYRPSGGVAAHDVALQPLEDHPPER